MGNALGLITCVTVHSLIPKHDFPQCKRFMLPFLIFRIHSNGFVQCVALNNFLARVYYTVLEFKYNVNIIADF